MIKPTDKCEECNKELGNSYVFIHERGTAKIICAECLQKR